MSTGLSIGIDLGTTYCCVAVLRHHSQKPEIIPNDQGKNTTPSFVAFDEENDVYAGETAKDLAFENPDSTVFDIKRLLGRSFYDPHIQKYMKLWPFQLVNVEGMVGVVIGERKILPQTITKELISHLRESAEVYLGCPIESAVVTVPAYFNDLQQGLTREACGNAGLKSVHFIHEPTAAAYAYGLQSSVEPNKTKICLIFDLGGGTFDVTLFRLNPSKRLEVIATGGDARLGGEDFNDLLTEYCIKEFEKLHGINLAAGKNSDDPSIQLRTAKILRRIRNECEKKKCFLSTTPKVVISLDAVYQEKALTVAMNRSIFEGLIHDHLARCMTTMDAILNKGGITKDAVDDVVLIGGSSRIPKVQQMVSEYFGGKILRKNIHTDEAVSYGAAVYAYNKFSADSTDGFVTVINSAESVQPYTSIHDAIIPVVKTKLVATTEADPKAEKQFKDLRKIRDLIYKYRNQFSFKAAELFNWLKNFELFEIEGKRASLSSPMAFEVLLSALLDTTLFLELSRTLDDKYEHEEGFILAETALKHLMSTFGPDNLKTVEAQYQVAHCMDSMTGTQHCLGEETNALKMFEIVYDKRCRLLGPNHPESLEVEFQITWLLQQLGKHHEALAKAKSILEKQKLVIGENHVQYLSTQVLIALCLHKLHSTSIAYKMTDDLYKQKLHLLTFEDRDRQCILITMCRIFQANEDYTKALKLYELLHKKQSSTLTPDHPTTLETLQSIAICSVYSNEYKRGVEILNIILQKQCKLIGEEHNNTLSTKHNLAWALNEQGHYKEAQSLYLEVYEQRKRILGPKHPNTIITKKNLDLVSARVESR